MLPTNRLPAPHPQPALFLPFSRKYSIVSGNGMVTMSWTKNSGMAMANADDKCMVVLYCPEDKRSVYITTGSERSVGIQTINAGVFKDKIVETWISFITADGAHVATSIYTGRLRVL